MTLSRATYAARAVSTPQGVGSHGLLPSPDPWPNQLHEECGTAWCCACQGSDPPTVAPEHRGV